MHKAFQNPFKNYLRQFIICLLQRYVFALVFCVLLLLLYGFAFLILFGIRI